MNVPPLVFIDTSFYIALTVELVTRDRFEIDFPDALVTATGWLCY